MKDNCSKPDPIDFQTRTTIMRKSLDGIPNKDHGCGVLPVHNTAVFMAAQVNNAKIALVSDSITVVI